MKTILSFLCCITMVAFITSCDNGDSGGSSGGGGDYPQVSFVKTTVGGEERVTCYNADNYSLTTAQICTWNCAYYNTAQPQFVQLTFNDGLICVPTGEVDETGAPIEECEIELALVDQELGACRL